MLRLPGHLEQPGQPLQEHRLHPAGHLVGVRQPVVVVEDEDGGDAAGADHEHDAAEVHSCQEEEEVLIISSGGADLPISGVVSVMGSMSPTMEEKMVMANIIVTPHITLRYQS